MIQASAKPKTAMQSFLDVVERVGNMVPHPVVIFLILIAIVIVLSAVLGAFGDGGHLRTINPETTRSRPRPPRSEACLTPTASASCIRR